MAGKNLRDSDRESERPYTPEPPQHMDPSQPPSAPAKRSSKKQSDKSPKKYDDVKKEGQQKPKKLGESESEIDDETTI